jgi:N-acetyl sugar amidotransferase
MILKYQIDKDGVCNHCHRYSELISAESYLKKRQPGALEELLRTVKAAGKGKEYDCVIGVSGGVDSTYTAYMVKQWGLRPLAVHLDNGWNSELAVSNIEKVLNNLDIDLYTHVLDWDEFRDLQLAFLRGGTPDAEIPTDHAILALLYRVASQHNIRYVLSGHNTATEGGGVLAWSQGHGDWLYVKSIHRQHGTRRISTYVHYNLWNFVYYSMVQRIRWVPVLDFLDYDKQAALEILETKLGWRNYESKHYESIYTRFYMGYFLPKKYGFEYKRLHLASLVWSGQLSRQQALELVEEDEYPAELQEQDREYVIKKLGITEKDFDDIMQSPPKIFWDYPSYKKIFRRITPLMTLYHRLKRD